MTTEFTGEAPLAQGDVCLTPIVALPESGIERVQPNQNGEYVITHSETGHDHCVKERPNVEMYQCTSDPLVAYLCVHDGPDVELYHKRIQDKHAAHKLEAGKTYQINRQREDSPMGWRRAVD